MSMLARTSKGLRAVTALVSGIILTGILSGQVVAATVAPGAEPKAGTPEPEFLCLKDLKEPLTGLSIACYTEAGCAYVQKNAGDPLPDYDQASVPYALGREKIEGIITSSHPIMTKIKEFGYSCKAL
jgi:hypothetical protein